MRLVLGGDEFVAAWVAAQIPHCPPFNKPRTIGLADESDNLVAAIVYHGYRPNFGDVFLSMAATSPRWATRGNIAMFLAFPFITLSCQRVTTIIAKRNKRSRKLNEGLGFKLEGVVRRGFRTDDALIYGLLREEAARWLGEQNGFWEGRKLGAVVN